MKNDSCDTPPQGIPEAAGRVGVCIQARIGSTRLPGKALLPLGNDTVLGSALFRLQRLPVHVHAVLSDIQSADRLETVAWQKNFHILPGHPDDVLSRFTTAVRAFELDTVIRATGDNPFVFIDCVFDLLRDFIRERADYAGYTDLPYGAGVEVVRAAALLEAQRRAVRPTDKEHVCPFIYEHPEEFRVLRQQAPQPYRCETLRLTVDTAEDYHRAQQIVAECPDYQELSDRIFLDRICRSTKVFRDV